VVTLSRLGGVLLVASVCACALDERKVAVARVGGNTSAVGAAGTNGGGGEGGGGATSGPSQACGNTAGEPGVPEVCTGKPVENPIITDFEAVIPDAVNPDCSASIGFYPPDLPTGAGTWVYNQRRLEPPVLSIVERGDGHALSVVATPGVPFSTTNTVVGFGIGWGGFERACLDASAYRGIRFTVEGTVGTCELRVGAAFSEDEDVRLNGSGSCTLENNCYPPRGGPVLLEEGTIEVPFVDMIGGSPDPSVDATSLLGINWSLIVPLDGPPCEVSLVIDDVEFYR
jgi:hypothetical protein